MSRFIVRRLPRLGSTAELLAGPVSVAVFASEDEALADCRAREAAARGTINPFECLQGRLAELTSLTHRMLGDFVLDAGLEPPLVGDDGSRDWADWWREESAAWTAEQRAHVWSGLDRLRLFDVVEQHGPGKAYLVLEIGWRKPVEPPLYTGTEMRRPVAAFSTRERAEARRAELEQQARRQWRNWRELSWPGLPDWPYAGAPVEEAPLFSVVEVDWEEPES